MGEYIPSYIPDGYRSRLDLYQTQDAIGLIKRSFESNLARALNLKRVSAPLFVDPASGLNDNLHGTEEPVSFTVPAAHTTAEVVHSLAKWKRLALHRYDFRIGKGLYTDMNAIRREEDLDNLHSIYVDQWDWEKIIPAEARTARYLEATVRAIVDSIWRAAEVVEVHYPQCPSVIDREVFFITAQELFDRYPDLSPAKREEAIAKEHHTVFVSQIGGPLSNGQPHDGRAPDYDDWSLNGDLLVYHPTLDCVVELSSMGIRVDPETLDRQLTAANCDDRRELPFHKMLLAGELPLTIGGGIGQSRLCMVLLGKAHIGEVQSSVWDDHTISVCEAAGVTLL